MDNEQLKCRRRRFITYSQASADEKWLIRKRWRDAHDDDNRMYTIWENGDVDYRTDDPSRTAATQEGDEVEIL